MLIWPIISREADRQIIRDNRGKLSTILVLVGTTWYIALDLHWGRTVFHIREKRVINGYRLVDALISDTRSVS